MKLKQFQVDAFTDHVFGGNPAAVVPLPSWPDDVLLQAIAQENNLSETAFFVPLGDGSADGPLGGGSVSGSGDGFHLRWFTPVAEVDLCGHATLATAYVIFEKLGHLGDVVAFDTLSGRLLVAKKGTMLEMDFPARPPKPCSESAILSEALGRDPIETLASRDYMAVFDSEASVRSIEPDHALLLQLDRDGGVIVTAPGDDVDFVSRFFAPKFGIPEDPVTGSAHCTLAPYWAERLGKNPLAAKQVSKRGGSLTCEVRDGRVLIAGRAVMFMEAELTVGDVG